MVTQSNNVLEYSNPRLSARFDDWPWGSKLKTWCYFEIEDNGKKGQRVKRTVIDPRTSRECKPKFGTYSTLVRIVDGSDGKTYIANYSALYGFISIEQSNLKYSQETINKDDKRFDKLLKNMADVLNSLAQ